MQKQMLYLNVQDTEKVEGATLYITLSPCQDCAKLIYQAGVKRVVYLEEYRYGNGLDFLEEVGIETEKITMK